MKIILLLIALGLVGCVTRKSALNHGLRMYEVGYSVARTETALENLKLSIQNTFLQEALRRKDVEAEERTRRSNPYAEK